MDFISEHIQNWFLLKEIKVKKIYMQDWLQPVLAMGRVLLGSHSAINYVLSSSGCQVLTWAAEVEKLSNGSTQNKHRQEFESDKSRKKKSY